MNTKKTSSVLDEVMEERFRQTERYGENGGLALGTGPDSRWLQPMVGWNASQIETRFRSEYETHETPTWMHLIREEVAEAFMEDDPVRLREELIQVAALCVSLITRLDENDFLRPGQN